MALSEYEQRVLRETEAELAAPVSRREYWQRIVPAAVNILGCAAIAGALALGAAVSFGPVAAEVLIGVLGVLAPAAAMVLVRIGRRRRWPG